MSEELDNKNEEWEEKVKNAIENTEFPSEKDDLVVYPEIVALAKDLQAIEFPKVELSSDDFKAEEEIPRVKYRHPQQILTRKDLDILINTKAEDLTEEDKSALKLYFIRLKGQNSKPKILSTAERKRRKKKRSVAKQSRKTNRIR